MCAERCGAHFLAATIGLIVGSSILRGLRFKMITLHFSLTVKGLCEILFQFHSCMNIILLYSVLSIEVCRQ